MKATKDWPLQVIEAETFGVILGEDRRRQFVAIMIIEMTV
jgi:hypothetical protein